jgi:hypothetical protein
LRITTTLRLINIVVATFPIGRSSDRQNKKIMKKIKLLFVGALVSSFSFAFASDEDPKGAASMVVVKKDVSLYNLIYKSPRLSDVVVTILNKDNEVVFKETIRKSNGFLRPYNLKDLSSGEYTFKVDNGLTSQTEHVNVGVATKDSNALEYASVIKLKNGKYLLALAGNGEKDFGVKIRNEKGDILYNTTEYSSGTFAQVYNLQEPSSVISFEITDNNNGQVKKILK